ncbi:MAG: tripartite tricarboxylate transporter TctB family protein [Anaerosolibacter sp.]|jgi:putative tricarboxylic transport membrane protein|uniref:tripartite tricarboxylate transporter TctB family protein n=1 Tax=Anaerosolibacter sp. TaxID=1872527 RepID=UPI00260CE677|nr:tripartite tricarboxylate transporter TctB family protein [Anaerosolibacter sp.]MDF2545413.1 tripartite tricarboxylate transporter TctB family protein [Anaerosolibacter sp.]
MNLSALTAVLTLVIGIIYSIQSYNLPRATIGSPMAPVYFPLGLGVLMAIFGIILLTQSVKRGDFKGMDNKEKGLTYTGKLIAYTCFVSIIYALIFEEAGFVISTILFLGSILFVVNGKDQWKTNTIVAVSFSLGIYIVFSKMLGIILPPLPFLYI